MYAHIQTRYRNVRNPDLAGRDTDCVYPVREIAKWYMYPKPNDVPFPRFDQNPENL